MNYQTKEELRSTMKRFFNQRAKAYRLIKLKNLENVCVFLRGRFDFIRDWNYWRQCLEVKNSEFLLLSILPSETGGHATERQHMLELIEHCKQIASMTSEQYSKKQAQSSPPSRGDVHRTGGTHTQTQTQTQTHNS